jgi:PAS domain S-box-containing protein
MPQETLKDSVRVIAPALSAERLLEGLLEHSLDAITLTDRASRRFLEVSDSFCALTGYDREELIGRTATELGLVADDTQRAAVTATGDRGRGGVYDAKIRRKDGTIRLLEISIQLLAGNEVALTISRDVTDREHAERRLAAQEARFRAAAESTPDGFAIISPVRNDCGEIVDFRFEYVNTAYARLVRHEREQLLGRRLGEVFPGFTDSERFSSCQEVVRTGVTCHTEDVAPADIVNAPGHAGVVLDVNLASMGEDLVVTARDVTERRHLEAQLRSSRERFQAAVEAMPDSFLIISPIRDDHGEIVDFRYEYANDAYCTLIQRDRDQLLGRTVNEVFPPFRGSERFELYRQVATTGEPVSSEQLGHQGAWAGTGLAERVFDTVVAPMGENLVVLHREITDRWNAQQARAAAEARLRDVIEFAPDAMVMVNADGEIQLVNEQAETLFGYTREELIGQNQELLVPDELRNRHRVHRATYGANPRARPMGDGLELFARRKDGSEIPVEISLSPLGDQDERLVCSAIRDISARRRIEHQRQLVEDELRASSARLAEAERIAGIGSWEHDLGTDLVKFSDGLLEIYGLSADRYDGTFASARGLVYPADREQIRETIDRAIADRSSYTVEYRAIRADGRVRNLRSHGDVVVDDRGSPVRVVGIVEDITDAKLTQEALQSASAELGRRANELQQLALRTATEPPEIPYAPLTARQLEIMQLIAQGLTNAAIAERLFLTEGTIKWHVRQILTKTNSTNRAEAIARVLGTAQ